MIAIPKSLRNIFFTQRHQPIEVMSIPCRSTAISMRSFLVVVGSCLLSGICYIGLSSCTSKPPQGMALIPAGSFLMGTDDTMLEEIAEEYGMGKPWVLDATPAHESVLPAFFMDRHEVTNAEYLRFVEAKGFSVLPHWPNGRPSPEQNQLPVVYVNWMEAQAYCDWIGERLPTEAEWEKAARGTDGRFYPWGNPFKAGQANVGGLYPGILPVGSLPGGNSPFGLSDMIGNVWEWVDSWYKPYPNSRYSSPDYQKRYRVVRGHSWAPLGHFEEDVRDQVVAAQARVTYRWYLPPNAAIEDVGFRCAKSVSD